MCIKGQRNTTKNNNKGRVIHTTKIPVKVGLNLTASELAIHLRNRIVIDREAGDIWYIW